ncbi:hypothetical protein [Spirosoma gilvum]
MKRILWTLLIFCLIFSSVYAQSPDLSARGKAELKKVSYLAGNWKGNVTYSAGNGKSITISQDEHVEFKLDGLLLSIEGIGKQQENVVFHAYAILYYDLATQQLKLKSFLKEGYVTEAYFKLLADNQFEWGYDIAGRGKNRSTITLDPTNRTWTEIGEYSSDGTNWLKTTELHLVKQE